jgi:Mg2+ and Co2+ transporter CorA
MPAGETEKSPSAWTIDSLHEHLVDAIAALREWIADHLHSNERLLEEMDRRYQQRFEAQQLAIDKAERTINDRLQGMNEFRATLDDQNKTFATRDELGLGLTNIADKISTLDTRLNTEVRRIDNRLDTTSGTVSGADKYRAALLAGLAAALGVAALIVNLVGR